MNTETTRYTLTDETGRRDVFGLSVDENVFASEAEAEATAQNLRETCGWHVEVREIR